MLEQTKIWKHNKEKYNTKNTPDVDPILNTWNNRIGTYV